MKRSFVILLFVLTFFRVTGWAQYNQHQARLWKLYYYSGELRLSGFYRQQERKGVGIQEVQTSQLINAGIFVNTRNYVWTPKFLLVDIDGALNPVRSLENFLVIPDQTENRDIRKLDTRITLFPDNKFSVSSYFNYVDLYNSRENLSSIKSTGQNWGNTAFYRTRDVAFSLGNVNWTQDETEVQTGRRFINKQNNVEGRVNNTFGKGNKQELTVSHNEFYRMDYNKNEITNYINNLYYNNFISFGSRRQNNLNTLLSGVWQRGSEIFDRYQAVENISVDLSKSLKANGNYVFFSDQRLAQSIYQNKIGGGIRHQLYESLQTQLSFEFNSSDNTFFNAAFSRGSLGLNYTKKLVKHHDLDLSYQYTVQSQQWNSADGVIPVINETYVLIDGQITLISRPYVNSNSIRVKDATSTVIYQLNVDYFLIPQGSFIQIQRMPGGQIPNGATVYVDYVARVPGTYQYASNNYLFSSGVFFFNRMFGVYYRRSKQDYDHLSNTEFITLNYLSQEVVGVKIDYKNLSGGAEYDDMNSTVLPYRLVRYYLNYSGILSKHLVVSMNGNVYDYKMLNYVKNILYTDASATATYHFTPMLSSNVSFAYRYQNGEGVDLDLLNIRFEVNASFHKLRLLAYYNFYNREVFSEKIRFNAVNFQISRIF